jgi:hypothetical protein
MTDTPAAPTTPPQHCKCGRELPCFDHVARSTPAEALDVERLAEAMHNDDFNCCTAHDDIHPIEDRRHIAAVALARLRSLGSDQ